jgi:hypothetical protein
MKFYVSDIGDSSVGIQELTVAELDLDQNMVEVLEDNNQMYSFKQEFKRLVEKYCEPEVSYEVYSDKDLEEEAKAEEEMQKAWEKEICAATKDNVKHTIGNGYKVEFECDRCRNRFWFEGGIAQVDCPVCSSKHLANHPIITGTKAEKITKQYHSEKPSVTDVLSGKVDIRTEEVQKVAEDFIKNMAWRHW